MAHNPEIVLDDGSILRFVVHETDVEGYDVKVIRVKKKK